MIVLEGLTDDAKATKVDHEWETRIECTVQREVEGLVGGPLRPSLL